jgi:protocatechuate 3,4-dioxygenase beta subunit
MIQALFSYLVCLSLFSCVQSNSHAQNEKAQKSGKGQQLVGGRCEGCEAIYESKVPFDALNEIDTLPIFNESGPKLVVSGTVYKSDGKTPAPGVVLYVYQTDQTGRYRVTDAETGWGRRHGSIRGWMKTNTRGQYKFYTIRPASYSKTGPPAHIHTIVKETDKNEYYIDDFHFDDDPFLTAEDRKRFRNQGGNGVLQLKERGGVFYAERNIYLGKNVQDYSTEKRTGGQLGFMIGLLF